MDGLARTRRPLQSPPRLITDAYQLIGETEWLPPFKAYMNSFERSAFATLLWALASAGYCRRRRFPYCRCATSRTGLWPLALGCKYRAANETRQGHSFAVLFLHRPAPTTDRHFPQADAVAEYRRPGHRSSAMRILPRPSLRRLARDYPLRRGEIS
jgi:hypothetical protein